MITSQSDGETHWKKFKGWVKISFHSGVSRVKAGIKFLPKLFSWYRKKTLCSVRYLLISSFLLLVALWIHNYYDSFYYVVKIDGREAGLVEEKEEIKDFLREQEDNKEEEHQMSVASEEEVNFVWEYRPWSRDKSEEIKEALSRLTYYTVGCQIVVEGEPHALVGNQEEYEKVLEEVKEYFIDVSEDRELMSANFQEDVSPEIIKAKPDKIESVEEVVDTLLGGKDKREVHQVSRGDNLSRIASEYDLTVSEVDEANPDLSDPHNIREGEEINLEYTDPLLTVETVEKVTVEESIPYRVETISDSGLWRGETRVKEPGEKGLKEVTYRVTRENEQEVDREQVEEQVLKDPRRQLEARGTASSPSSASGPFKWPVEGGGTITQGFHSGHRAVDIASSHRTPILAAHSGTVDRVERFAGAAGHYIHVKHDIDGTIYYTRYLHNDENLVSVGDEVSQGEVIAYMGDTGRTTGVHLHFEIHRGGLGNPVNPLDYFDE